MVLLKNLKSAQYHLESKDEEIFEVLFWKETSHDVKFEAGENGINVSNFIFYFKVCTTDCSSKNYPLPINTLKS